MKRKILCGLLTAVMCLTSWMGAAPGALEGNGENPAGMRVFAENAEETDAGTPAADPDQDSDQADGRTGDPSEDPSDNREEEPAEEIVITSFADVQDASKYYYTPVYWAVERKITNGTDAVLRLFSPDLGCTRGQIVTFLWRAAGSPEPDLQENPFTDVRQEDYFCRAVLWAVENGITKGVTDTTFEPSSTCTRAQSVTLIGRYCGADMNGRDTFTDVKSGTYYYDTVYWAVQNGITNGVGAKQFAPDATCTRGQIVSFLYHALLDTSVKKTEAGASGNITITDVDGQKATFRINVSDVKADSEIKEVRASVASGSGADRRWFTLSRSDSGIYTRVVEAMDLSGFTAYSVTWYLVTGDCQLIRMDATTVEVEKVNYATVTDIGNRQFRIIIEGVDPSAASVTSCVWSDANGNDDVKWCPLSKTDETTWQVVINCPDFADSGLFLADIYSSDKLLATLRFDVPASYLVLTVQEQVDKETEKVYESVGRDLRACFNYSVGITYYRSTPEPQSGYTNSQWYALYGFRNHKGHCYVHAATFYWLAKNLGYNARYIQGYVPRAGGGLITHGWVEIDMNGTTYVFDPNFTNETGKNGYKITYGASGTWRYQSYRQYS